MSSGDFSSQSLPSDASGQAIEMTNYLKQTDDLFYRYSLVTWIRRFADGPKTQNPKPETQNPKPQPPRELFPKTN